MLVLSLSFNASHASCAWVRCMCERLATTCHTVCPMQAEEDQLLLGVARAGRSTRGSFSGIGVRDQILLLGSTQPDREQTETQVSSTPV